MVVIARVLFYTIRLLTRLQVGASDSSAAVATKFGQRHGLTSEAISRLTRHIESRRLANEAQQQQQQQQQEVRWRTTDSVLRLCIHSDFLSAHHSRQ